MKPTIKEAVTGIVLYAIYEKKKGLTFYLISFLVVVMVALLGYAAVESFLVMMDILDRLLRG